MNDIDANKIISKYIKPIFGFALKRCRNIQDAEDLSQNIAIKVYRALLIKDDIQDVDKFVWTVAHNALSNYYRDIAESTIGIPLEEVAESLADTNFHLYSDDNDTVARLQKEIAYLSEMQRKIVVAYYFENRKQTDIAKQLGIPVGTVKWHLFEAKKELKRGIEKKRETSQLKFDPIQFRSIWIDGTVAKKSPKDTLKSLLAQNICYCVRNKAKTVNEIASDLGVSPVFVGNEAEILEEYGLLSAQGNKYIVNFLISEPTEQLLALQDEIYDRAAELFANKLYDELLSCKLLDDDSIVCEQSEGVADFKVSPEKDINFVLWTLIPYIAARSGEKSLSKDVSFDEVATFRPDGAYNIIQAEVIPDGTPLSENYADMAKWSGPMWYGNGKHILWQINSKWSDRDTNVVLYAHNARRVLSLFEEKESNLSKDDCAWLCQNGYIKTYGQDTDFRKSWQIVILSNNEIRDRLLAIGDRIRNDCRKELQALKEPYEKAVMSSVPPHLKKVQAYELQFIFQSDGLFLLHCIKTLLNNGKLKPPTTSQRKSLSTLIVNE